MRAARWVWLLGLFCTGAAWSAGVQDPFTHFFYQGFGNLQDEAKTARADGKMGVLVMFNDPDCPWCAKMKATVLNQPPVQTYFRQHFRPVHVDTRGATALVNFSGKETSEKDFAFKENRVRATPVFVFFDLDGKPVVRYTGATRNAEEFLWLGEYVVSGAHKTKNFTVYKRERSARKG